MEIQKQKQQTSGKKKEENIFSFGFICFNVKRKIKIKVFVVYRKNVSIKANVVTKHVYKSKINNTHNTYATTYI